MWEKEGRTEMGGRRLDSRAKRGPSSRGLWARDLICKLRTGVSSDTALGDREGGWGKDK